MFILNMLVYACVALSLAFLVSKLTQSEQILSMCANVISLGMAFLCRIFVPREFLSDTVMAIAHFLPAYWYANATGTRPPAGLWLRKYTGSYEAWSVIMFFGGSIGGTRKCLKRKC